MKIVAVVLGIVGLYFNLWHNNVPFNHFQVFGQGFGTQHVLHSVVGLILVGAAAWLWYRAERTAVRA